MTGATDGQLVRAILAGDRQGYARLVERYEDILYRRALSIVADPDAAADVVQETFVRAYERLARCGDPDRFGGWVYRMLRNRCLDEVRAGRRRARPLSAADDIASDHDPEADLERGGIRTAIAAALQTLSPALREAFVLKHVDGLSYDDMQDATGVARSALKMRVKRAREELELRLRSVVDLPVDVTSEAPTASMDLNTAIPSMRGKT